MLTILLTIVHVIVCLFIIIVVLLQSGQSADIAAAFGGAGSQTAFGPRGATTVLSKATTWAAVLFMLTSISLSIFASRERHSTGSVLNNMKTTPAKTAPAPTNQPSPNPTTPTPQQK
ncbi:MAG: preprotein translocase subunit SecG [Terriglobales bacterium]